MPRKMKNARWSFKEDRRVLELAAHSKSPDEIANLMSRSPEAIRKVAIRLGISLSKNKQRSTPSERLMALRVSMSSSGG
jgi:hypothetical protein